MVPSCITAFFLLCSVANAETRPPLASLQQPQEPVGVYQSTMDTVQRLKTAEERESVANMSKRCLDIATRWMDNCLEAEQSATTNSSDSLEKFCPSGYEEEECRATIAYFVEKYDLVAMGTDGVFPFVLQLFGKEGAADTCTHLQSQLVAIGGFRYLISQECVLDPSVGGAISILARPPTCTKANTYVEQLRLKLSSDTNKGVDAFQTLGKFGIGNGYVSNFLKKVVTASAKRSNLLHHKGLLGTQMDLVQTGWQNPFSVSLEDSSNNKKSCLHGDTRLSVQDHSGTESSRRLADVRPGELVQSMDNKGKLQMSPVVLLGGHSGTDLNPVLNVQCQQQQTGVHHVQLTPSHLIDHWSAGQHRLCRAAELKAGDKLLLSNSTCTVSSVQTEVVPANELYFALTCNGNLLANGDVVVSSFVDHWQMSVSDWQTATALACGIYSALPYPATLMAFDAVTQAAIAFDDHWPFVLDVWRALGVTMSAIIVALTHIKKATK